MVEFMENKENRSEFEETQLEIDIKNGRGDGIFMPQTVLYHCH